MAGLGIGMQITVMTKRIGLMVVFDDEFYVVVIWVSLFFRAHHAVQIEITRKTDRDIQEVPRPRTFSFRGDSTRHCEEDGSESQGERKYLHTSQFPLFAVIVHLIFRAGDVGPRRMCGNNGRGRMPDQATIRSASRVRSLARGVPPGADVRGWRRQ